LKILKKKEKIKRDLSIIINNYYIGRVFWMDKSLYGSPTDIQELLDSWAHDNDNGEDDDDHIHIADYKDDLPRISELLEEKLDLPRFRSNLKEMKCNASWTEYLLGRLYHWQHDPNFEPVLKKRQLFCFNKVGVRFTHFDLSGMQRIFGKSHFCNTWQKAKRNQSKNNTDEINADVFVAQKRKKYI